MILRTLTTVLLFLSLLNAAEYRRDFENTAPGKLPKGWIVEATHAGSRTAQWHVTLDATRPKSQQHVLTLTESGNSMFNLCYDPDIRMKDGRISVLFHANRGRIDQGGGIMWRVQDGNNYYVARFNPLEDNFRFYSVIQAQRHLICTNDNVHLSKGWHRMTIEQEGKRFKGFIDGRQMLTCEDKQIDKIGAAGVWTKADAATSFDDFVLKGRP